MVSDNSLVGDINGSNKKLNIRVQWKLFLVELPRDGPILSSVILEGQSVSTRSRVLMPKVGFVTCCARAAVFSDSKKSVLYIVALLVLPPAAVHCI